MGYEKNYGDVKIPQNFEGYESTTGYYDYWYPDFNRKIEIPKEIECRHLYLWRNQGDYIAFAVPLNIFENCREEKKEQFACIWFSRKLIDNIVENS